MKKYFILLLLLASTTAWAERVAEDGTVLPTSEFGDEETLSPGFITDIIDHYKEKNASRRAAETPTETLSPADLPSPFPAEEEEEHLEYGRSVSKYATVPVFGGYIIGSYKYSSQNGQNNGAGFNARLIRVYVDGTLLRDFNYRLQVELNGSPHIKDFYLEWAHWKEFSVKIGQFKRAFTFENPMNPWDVGVGDYSQAVKKLAGMGDKCGEASTGGRDQGLQFQGDLFPIGNDKHRLLHYQVAMYNGNGINASDNNKHKDFMGTIQFQPIKGLFIGVFGWTGDWKSGDVTVKRNRFSVGAKYDYNGWSARAEYVRAFGHKVSEYDEVTGTFSGTGKADSFYATLGVPILPWLKIYAKYDMYRDQATFSSMHTIYSICPNFQLHKNLQIQLQYNFNNDRTLTHHNYHELWLETYVRF